MDKIVIELLKDGVIVGNILFHYDGFFPNAISKVMEIIDNYNVCLSKDSFFNEELAIRMFERENKSGNSKIWKPILAKDSEIFMKKEFPSVYLSDNKDTNYDAGVIAITNRDKQANLSESIKVARIDMDKKTVSFMGTHRSILKSEWNKYNSSDPSDLTVCEYNFSDLPFNELDDAWYFVRRNLDGWLEEEYCKAKHIFEPVAG